MKMKWAVVIFIVIVVLVGVFFFRAKEQEIYKVTGNTLAYSEERGKTNYEVIKKWENDSVEIREIKFKSRPFQNQETYIYGYLFLPKGKENVPGFVFLPAGEATKESREKLLIKLAKEGYASLAIDQRGVGDTGGTFLWIDQDYQIFKQGDEPVQHLAVYDALRSFDVLREIKEIDEKKIGFAGESMGGRYALIAASIEKRSKGAIVISSAGFNVPLNPMQEANDYLLSIDPDHYVSGISPRYLAMLHGTNDTVVPIKNAQITFNKAKEPRSFYIAEGCEHGYCEKMWNELVKDLGVMFG